jgi:metal-responsive CopG/Arc/MetJ family transcriptional regulator
MKTIAITIDNDTLARIDRLLNDGLTQGKNRSQIIRQAVREYVSRLDRMAVEERERQIFRKHKRKLAREAVALVKEQAKL